MVVNNNTRVNARIFLFMAIPHTFYSITTYNTCAKPLEKAKRLAYLSANYAGIFERNMFVWVKDKRFRVQQLQWSW